jgi:cytochrome c553
MKTKRLFAGILAGVLTSIVAVAAEVGSAAETSLDERLDTVMSAGVAVQAAVKAGGNIASFCANCHGVGGNSIKPNVPNLAGQNPAFLLEQMKKFIDGRRRNHFMTGMIRSMSDGDKVNTVVFYSVQEVKPHGPANPALANQGKQLFFRFCQQCHGEQGRGNEKVARIAGQQPEYLTLSLKRYRDGTGERADPLMATSTENLTDDDIEALVAFVSGMK